MSRSEFPEKVDSFQELFDLPADKVNAANELTTLKMKSVLDNNEQNRVKALTAELQDYIISPEVWNKLTDCMVALETFFDENIRGYILDKQKEWDTYVNDFSYVGVWSSTGKYKRQNLIGYQGNLWLVIKDVTADTAHTPDKDLDHYRQCAWKGEKGDIGLNAIFKGYWDGSTAYKIGDAVTIRLGDDWQPTDMVFICQKDNTGQKPDLATTSDYWFPYNPLMVGTTMPTTLHSSTHFLQLLD